MDKVITVAVVYSERVVVSFYKCYIINSCGLVQRLWYNC